MKDFSYTFSKALWIKLHTTFTRREVQEWLAWDAHVNKPLPTKAFDDEWTGTKHRGDK